MLITDNFKFKPKSIAKDRKGHYSIMTNVSIHQEDIIIINMYTLIAIS